MASRILELLAYEARLETQIAKDLEALRLLAAELKRTKEKLRKSKDLVTLLTDTFDQLKKAKVVSISEYRQVVSLLRANRTLVHTLKTDLNRIDMDCRILKGAVSSFESQLQNLRAEIADFGHVLEFPKNDNGRSEEEDPRG